MPTKHITFATLQTADVDVNGVSETHLVNPGATALFWTIADDQSLTTVGGGKTAPSATPTVPPPSISVQVQNGTTVTGRAAAISGEPVSRGFGKQTTSGDGPASAETAVTCPAGEQVQAQSVAKALGIPSGAVRRAASGTGVVLLIGSDRPTGTTFPGGRTTVSDAQKKSALDGASSRLGSAKGRCAPVSRFTDVTGVDAAGRATDPPRTRRAPRPRSARTPSRRA